MSCAGGTPPSFAERLRRVGLELDWEVRQVTESANQNARREVRQLQDEVHWLQMQLEGERRQSAARLELCCALRRQLEEAQRHCAREVEARDYFQRECTAFEERHSLLEAKLAAVELDQAERVEETAALDKEGGAPLAEDNAAEVLETSRKGDSQVSVGSLQRSQEHLRLRPEEAASDAEEACVAGSEDENCEGIQQVELDDPASVDRCLSILQASKWSTVERQLRTLSVEDLHLLLMKAVTKGKGCGFLIHRLVRLWIGKLLLLTSGSLLRAAVHEGSHEAIAALLSLGGAQLVALAALPQETPAAPQDADSVQPEPAPGVSGGVLGDCIAKSDLETLSVLVDSLRAFGGEALPSIRKARQLALQMGKSDMADVLSAHLVVELSLQGNARYRRGGYEGAIGCYQEAIEICTAVGQPEGGAAAQAGKQVRGPTAENLVRLRYNLARALHRIDRWTEACQQATAVIELDPGYVNAYALRAQAAMASWDWKSARADWDSLLSLAQRGSSSHPIGEEVISAWRRRREECCRQLAAGFYEALGLPRFSELEAVRRAYKDLARRWHPDKNQHRSADHRERATRRFSRIQAAYEALSEACTKRRYDAELLLMEARPVSPGLHFWRSGCAGPTPAGAGADVEVDGHRRGRARTGSHKAEDQFGHPGMPPVSHAAAAAGAAASQSKFGRGVEVNVSPRNPTRWVPLWSEFGGAKEDRGGLRSPPPTDPPRVV